MGLGRHGGGVGAARFLAAGGAELTITDSAGETSLADSLAKLNDVPGVQYVLGGHRDEDFTTPDLLLINPAVRPGNRFVELARAAGVPFTTEIELFLRDCPAKSIGVTGSNGKSTTAAMVAAILAADGRRTWLGGNIGRSLLDDLPRIAVDDWVVLELSSFQLARLNVGTPSTDVAVITQCTPNHLDWHGTQSHYVWSKQELLSRQSRTSLAVLNPHDDEVRSWASLVNGECLAVPPIERLPPLLVKGEHNRRNAACAAAAAAGIGCHASAVEQGLATFRGLPQRLEFVGEVQRRRFYSDSQATTPESTIAALETVEGPCWLLAGGADKGSEFGRLAAAISHRARGAAFYGTVRSKLAAALRAQSASVPHSTSELLSEAFAWCWRHSKAGDAILLSPACSSLDQFRDWADRGDCFLELVRTLDESA